MYEGGYLCLVAFNSTLRTIIDAIVMILHEVTRACPNFVIIFYFVIPCFSFFRVLSFVVVTLYSTQVIKSVLSFVVTTVVPRWFQRSHDELWKWRSGVESHARRAYFIFCGEHRKKYTEQEALSVTAAKFDEKNRRAYFKKCYTPRAIKKKQAKVGIGMYTTDSVTTVPALTGGVRSETQSVAYGKCYVNHTTVLIATVASHL